MYIGSGRDLAARLSRHGLTDQQRVKVKLSRRFGDWLMWEARLIRRLKPIRNTNFTGRRQQRVCRDYVNGINPFDLPTHAS